MDPVHSRYKMQLLAYFHNYHMGKQMGLITLLSLEKFTWQQLKFVIEDKSSFLYYAQLIAIIPFMSSL